MLRECSGKCGKAYGQTSHGHQSHVIKHIPRALRSMTFGAFGRIINIAPYCSFICFLVSHPTLFFFSPLLSLDIVLDVHNDMTITSYISSHYTGCMDASSFIDSNITLIVDDLMSSVYHHSMCKGMLLYRDPLGYCSIRYNVHLYREHFD